MSWPVHSVLINHSYLDAQLQNMPCAWQVPVAILIWESRSYGMQLPS